MCNHSTNIVRVIVFLYYMLMYVRCVAPCSCSVVVGELGRARYCDPRPGTQGRRVDPQQVRRVRQGWTFPALRAQSYIHAPQDEESINKLYTIL